MADIFFANEWIKNNVVAPEGMTWQDDPTTGYGNLRTHVREWAELRGHVLHEEPEGCQVELHVGDPGVKPDRHFSPAIIFTMFELSRFPDGWCEDLAAWDLIALPSKWCMRMYREQLRERGFAEAAAKIRYAQLGIRLDDFPYSPRDDDRDFWTVLVQGVELRDRKGLMLIHDMLQNPRYALPDDLKIVMKILPIGPHGVIIDGYEMPLQDNVFLCARALARDDYIQLLHDCDYSVNPTAGEGFGFIPLEHMRTGLGVAVTHWSGVMDYATQPDEPWFKRINHALVPGQMPRSKVAAPSIPSLYKAIMWSYNNRAAVREVGARGSEWVGEHWSCTNLYKSLDALVDEALTLPRIDNPNRKPIAYEYNEEFTMVEKGT